MREQANIFLTNKQTELIICPYKFLIRINDLILAIIIPTSVLSDLTRC